MQRINYLPTALAVIFLLLLPAARASAVDEEACLECHKYTGLRTEAEAGSSRSFHVDEEVFASSVHAAVTCRGCHVDISRIPHGEGEGKVNCGVSCHIYTDTEERPLSHEELYNKYLETVHGKAVDNGPDCLYCHARNEPKSGGEDRREEAEELCAGCHVEGRLRPERTGRTGPTVVDDVYHRLSIVKNYEDAPGCVDCHPVHDIYHPTDARSSVNADSIGSTCGGAYSPGKGCHSTPGESLVAARIHDRDLAYRRARSTWSKGPWIAAMLLVAPLALRMVLSSLRS